MATRVALPLYQKFSDVDCRTGRIPGVHGSARGGIFAVGGSGCGRVQVLEWKATVGQGRLRVAAMDGFRAMGGWLVDGLLGVHWVLEEW